MQLHNLGALDDPIPCASLNALGQSLGIGIEERRLSKYRSPLSLSCARVISTRQGSVRHNPVVPVRDTAGLPLPADGEIVGRMEVLAQEVERVDALLALELGDVDDEEGVIEQGF